MIAAHGGRIVNVVSPAGFLWQGGRGELRGREGAGSWRSPRSLAREVARFGITVNAVSPGLVGHARSWAGWRPTVGASSSGQIPLGPARDAGRDRRRDPLPLAGPHRRLRDGGDASRGRGPHDALEKTGWIARPCGRRCEAAHRERAPAAHGARRSRGRGVDFGEDPGRQRTRTRARLDRRARSWWSSWRSGSTSRSPTRKWGSAPSPR